MTQWIGSAFAFAICTVVLTGCQDGANPAAKLPVAAASGQTCGGQNLVCRNFCNTNQTCIRICEDRYAACMISGTYSWSASRDVAGLIRK
jgi:hypothetical protein